MSNFELVPRVPVTLAVADGAITPDPGGTSAKGAVCWSSTTSRLMSWDGSRWSYVTQNGLRPKFALIGDSQLQSGMNPQAITSVSGYNSTTGVLSITQNSHGYVSGLRLCLTVRNDPQWNVFSGAITVTGTNTYTIVTRTGITSPSTPTAVDLRVCKIGDMSDGGINGWLLSACPWVSFAGNWGVTGETASQIAVRVPDIINNYDFDAVFFQAGHNDITVGGTSASQILTDIKTSIALLVAAGKKVFYINVSPFSSSYGGSSTTTRSKIVELNRLAARQLPELYPGVIVCDIFAQAVDLTNVSTPPSAKSGYVMSDGLHWGA